MKEIKIFAPSDGFVKYLAELNDGVFSEGMLGDGFVFEPSSKTLYSPLEKGEVAEIFHTKHAFFFKSEEAPTILMHIGLETVKLNGKPFKVKVNKNEKINLNSEIVEVDLKLLNDLNLVKSTPIVLDSMDSSNWKFVFKKTGKVKKGELIGVFSENSKVEKSNLEAYFGAENKYSIAAVQLNSFVGGKSNYSEVYNCMTRLRFKINDKSKVDENKISENQVVKGIIWNGEELQIVIGQDVYKLKDEISKLDVEINKNDKKQPFLKRSLAMFSGIMVPLIPIFIGTGLIQALIGILTLTNIMPTFTITSEGMEAIKNATGWDIFWLMLFVTGKSAPLFNGIAVAVSASKYFGLRLYVGVGIGLILSSPILFLGGGAFGAGGEWVLFTLGKINVSDPQLQYILDRWLTIMITAGNLKIFVIIPAVYFGKVLDEWIKTWISPLFELTCRSFLVYLIVGMFSLCILMPVWNFSEGIIGIIMYFISKIPFGIGLGVYTGLWQIFVIFGIHGTVGTIAVLQALVSLTSGQGGYAVFVPGQSISVYSQIGAIIGLIIVTKNKELKKQAMGMVPVGFLGITEPIIYGITLPRKRLFIAAIISAFIAGTFAGLVGVTARIGTGVGIFEGIGYFQYTAFDVDGTIAKATGQLSWIANGLWYVASCAIALVTAILISILMYKERISEKKSINIINKKLFNYIKKRNNLNYQEKENILNDLKGNFINLSSQDEIEIKKIEKILISILKAKVKISNIEEKQIKEKNKLSKRGRKAFKNNNIDQAEKIKSQIENSKYIFELEQATEKLNQIEKTLNLDWLNQFITSSNKEIINKIKKLNIFNKNELELLKNNYEEALSSVLIAYNFKKPFTVSEKFNFKK
ncbi:hypothetical protein CK556_00105 [Mesoplasma chauliocola]|uniref:Uncharacterized protein n=1 Tax=Mesoplasma chauliocola TaxID=216427 RepID=A0A249SMD3_9MOLU|nr:PTS glucose transporter subunit IIABC [Mesoplasma chauliocola]ASZ08773.1 hypothetical protein CK556_00105 [Mesoplasma chauliocola]